MKPHKHAELIKAWADGAEIEAKWPEEDEWVDSINPTWSEGRMYRIKPEPKPDVVQFWRATSAGLYMFGTAAKNNLKLTFDGETSELKSAEVLK